MNTNDSISKNALSPGLILGLVLAAYSLVTYIFDIIFEQWAGYLVYFIVFGFLFWSIKQYRDKHLHGFITFGKAWKVGFVICFYAAIIGLLFSFVLYNLIDPDLHKSFLRITEEKLMENQALSDELIAAQMEMMKKIYTNTILPLIGFASTLFVALLLPIFTAFFVQKKENRVE